MAQLLPYVEECIPECIRGNRVKENGMDKGLLFYLDKEMILWKA
jgi:hypothetical protein